MCPRSVPRKLKARSRDRANAISSSPSPSTSPRNRRPGRRPCNKLPLWRTKRTTISWRRCGVWGSFLVSRLRCAKRSRPCVMSRSRSPRARSSNVSLTRRRSIVPTWNELRPPVACSRESRPRSDAGASSDRRLQRSAYVDHRRMDRSAAFRSYVLDDDLCRDGRFSPHELRLGDAAVCALRAIDLRALDDRRERSESDRSC